MYSITDYAFSGSGGCRVVIELEDLRIAMEVQLHCQNGELVVMEIGGNQLQQRWLKIHGESC